MAQEEEVTYTRNEIVEGLSNNLSMAFNFVLDNNYTAVVEALNNEGFRPDNDEDALANLTFLFENDRPKFLRVLENVQYNNAAGNWTEGLDEIFRPQETRPAEGLGGGEIIISRSAATIWGSILTGISAFGTSLLSSSNPPLTPAEIEAARVAAAEEKKRKDRNTLIIILVLVALVIGVAIYMKSSKKKAN